MGCYYAFDGELDSEEAVRWFLKAASQGHVEAEYALGFHFQYGIGVVCDPEEAVRRYRLAAGMGHIDAQGKLGLCYLMGQGVTQSDSEAVKWLVKAAKYGYSEALEALDSLGYFDKEDTTSESRQE